MAKLQNGRRENGARVNGGYVSDADFQSNRISVIEDAARVRESSKDHEKTEWNGGLEFLMACIASSVGLGNVWRFPFTAYENGGGAFLIPYIIVLIFVGKPTYYLEGVLGQFTGKSCGKVWLMCPAMRGIGYGQVITAFWVVTYYCSLMALTMYYLISSFESVLPWSYCREDWTNCIDTRSSLNRTLPEIQNFSSSAEIYFRKIVLNEAPSIDDGLGLPSLKLSLCLAAGWLAVFATLCRGVKSTGKAAYFLAIFPYVIMIVLLVRAVTLAGAIKGILFFVTPKWESLWQAKVWYSGITQCYFSLAVCFGPIITYSSHNKFRHPVDRDVMIVTTLDTFTSLMAGCTIFGILGNLAHEMGTDDISSVVRGGTGLAFISYPDALSRFTVVPQLFAVMFFVMMFVLGTGSAMALCVGILGILCDHFPNTQQWKMALILCIVGFLFGLPYVTPGGQWFVTLIDYYGGTFIALVVGLLQIVTVSWFYGLGNFLNDIEFMLGSRPNLYWRLCWSIITPVFMIIVLIYTVATYIPPTYDGMEFPKYAYATGWTILGLGILQIIVWIVAKLWKNRRFSPIKMLSFPRTIGDRKTLKRNWNGRNLLLPRKSRLNEASKNYTLDNASLSLIFRIYL
ncbi:sodium-dependent nutrient amino acid transporter 1-like isoform X1 [Venturia canescens]|uniref:sodium-dependent nutrient amino acid transporter 1-like isoform X1 n=1 Tax=Venturia canescens TaxID=32260 RepID=UPI001C9CD7D6|nr:sodium-dependent nutrient amino acid transporter 1-like isoform X1 [Venturia canescens]